MQLKNLEGFEKYQFNLRSVTLSKCYFGVILSLPYTYGLMYDHSHPSGIEPATKDEISFWATAC